MQPESCRTNRTCRPERTDRALVSRPTMSWCVAYAVGCGTGVWLQLLVTRSHGNPAPPSRQPFSRHIGIIRLRTATDGRRGGGDSKPAPPSSHEYLERIIKKAQRKTGFPIRRSFVQTGALQSPRPGPLAAFVKSKDPRALDLFLLAVTAATNEPYSVTFPAETCARALTIKHFSVVSRAWSRLEDRKLIKRQRAGNRTRSTLLKEDGSGKPYTHPFKGTKSEHYGQLPLEYWLDNPFA